MNRRTLILSGAAALALPALPAFAAPIAYKPGLLQERLNAGETVFLDFKASWCSTCRAQERVINALKTANPTYEQKITFIDVDWDDYGKSELVSSLNVPRRSTLIALKGNQEIGRIVADTAEASIKALMDAALAASVA